MPTSIVTSLLARVAVLESKVESLISYQKWQIGFLTAILAAVVGAWAAR